MENLQALSSTIRSVAKVCESISFFFGSVGRLLIDAAEILDRHVTVTEDE
jgi:hypothetical protein